MGRDLLFSGHTDAIQLKSVGVPIVKDFDRIAVEDADHLASEISSPKYGWKEERECPPDRILWSLVTSGLSSRAAGKPDRADPRVGRRTVHLHLILE